MAARAFRMTVYRAIQMGIWMIIGPRQPRGLTPWALYSLMVSWDSFCLSLAYFFWSSWILGCRDDMA